MNLFNIPSSSTELCFDSNEFFKTNFSVDDFLHNYRYSATLETFRDDLGIYLKILRSAMIELINEDYADFVNLSSNLVNLDKSINIIKDPLIQLREEILTVRTNLQDCMNEINECLNEKRRFRQIRKSLSSLETSRKSLEKIRKLMDSLNSDDDKERSIILERVALELIQLQFNVKYCNHFINSNEKSLIDEQEVILLNKLNEYFLQALDQNSSSNELERCLRIYYTLDKCKLAEDIFRKETSTYMENIISEKNLHKNPDNLTGIYNQILDFVSLRMKQLLSLTRGKTIKVKGYNFLFNSFWSATEERLESNLTSIFNPGLPDQFYQKFKCTIEFLKRIEMIIDDPVLIEKFHDHEQYRKFQKRWNLPVYFQIRNQEISASFEKFCDINWDTIIVQSDSNQMQVKVFVEVINSIASCWTDGIFLDQLYSNFLKLTLQLTSRAVRWTNDVLKQTSENGEELKIDLQSFYSVLYRDIGILILKFPQIEELLHQKLKENSVLKDKMDISSIKKCFEAPQNGFSECQRNIESQIMKKLMISCLKSIKNVQDIPRLFRKTNREVPTKHLPYVDQILQPINDFIQNYSQNYQPEVIQRILTELFSKLTIQYYQSVSEVLTSVQRTEESLRRLKNLKKSQSSSIVNDERQLMSDDDKIRLQLQIDIMQYVKCVEEYKLKREEIDSLVAIINLIGDITKVKLAIN